MHPSEIMPFDSILETLYAFEKELRQRCGQAISIGTPGEDRALSLIGALSDFKSAYEKKSGLKPDKDYAEALGLIDLLYDCYIVRSHPHFEALCPHLQLLDEEKGSISQLVRSSILDQNTSNKIIELLVAALVMRCCAEIELDHPKHSKGDNPDILASIHFKRWGIGIKTLQSDGHKEYSPQSFVDNVESAIKQIEDSPHTEIGIVIINMKNLISFEESWHSSGGIWPAFEPAFEEIRKSWLKLSKAIQCSAEWDRLTGLFVGKKAQPLILVYFGAASEINFQGKPRPTMLRFFEGFPCGPVHSETAVLVYQLNEYLHRR